MKRSILLALLLLSSLSWGQGFNAFQQTTFVSVTNANPIIENTLIGFHQLSWTVSGTVATCTVAIDTSADGSSWTAGGLIAGQTCTSNGNSIVTAGSATWIRVNMTAISGAGATVVVTYKGWVQNPSGGGGGTTINPTNNVLPKRSNATTFVDSALADNGTTVTNTEPETNTTGGTALTHTQGTITTSNPTFSHTATWNAGGVAFTNWLSNLTCTAAAANSIALGLGTGGNQWQFKYIGANCASPVLLAPDGTVTNPAYGFSGLSTMGMLRSGTALILQAASGNGSISLASGTITLNDGNSAVTITSGALTNSQKSFSITGAPSSPGTASTNGQAVLFGASHEQITLNTAGTTTDSTNNLLPAGAVLLGVVYRITTTITTAANFTIGDGTTAARFCASQSTLTAGTTATCAQEMQGSITTDAAGPVQAAAAKLRITTNVNPGAGVIRVTLYYMQFTPPTS